MKKKNENVPEIRFIQNIRETGDVNVVTVPSWVRHAFGLKKGSQVEVIMKPFKSINLEEEDKGTFHYKYINNNISGRFPLCAEA
jgi:bifunctional DNA-binding transcriptional regulator/antitoxin component of YhaV-PrlF toxin-antitoxin module